MVFGSAPTSLPSRVSVPGGIPTHDPPSSYVDAKTASPSCSVVNATCLPCGEVVDICPEVSDATQACVEATVENIQSTVTFESSETSVTYQADLNSHIQFRIYMQLDSPVSKLAYVLSESTRMSPICMTEENVSAVASLDEFQVNNFLAVLAAHRSLVGDGVSLLLTNRSATINKPVTCGNATCLPSGIVVDICPAIADDDPQCIDSIEAISNLTMMITTSRQGPIFQAYVAKGLLVTLWLQPEGPDRVLKTVSWVDELTSTTLWSSTSDEQVSSEASKALRILSGGIEISEYVDAVLFRRPIYQNGDEAVASYSSVETCGNATCFPNGTIVDFCTDMHDGEKQCLDQIWNAWNATVAVNITAEGLVYTGYLPKDVNIRIEVFADDLMTVTTLRRKTETLYFSMNRSKLDTDAEILEFRRAIRIYRLTSLLANIGLENMMPPTILGVNRRRLGSSEELRMLLSAEGCIADLVGCPAKARSFYTSVMSGSTVAALQSFITDVTATVTRCSAGIAGNCFGVEDPRRVRCITAGITCVGSVGGTLVPCLATWYIPTSKRENAATCGLSILGTIGSCADAYGECTSKESVINECISSSLSCISSLGTLVRNGRWAADTMSRLDTSVECAKVSKHCQENIGGGWGDVHVLAFDNLKYDCQARCEIWYMFNSGPSSFQFQVRQVPCGRRDVSCATAFVATESGASVVQYDASTDATLVDGINLEDNLELRNVSIIKSPTSISVQFSSGVVTSATRRDGFRINFLTTVPPAFVGRAFGVLGNPNGIDDDLQSRDGRRYSSSFVSLYGSHLEYDVCRTWCTTSTESLFVYAEGEDHCLYDKSNESNVFLAPSTPPADIVETCGGEPSCITDLVATNSTEMALESKSFFETIISQPNAAPTISVVPTVMSAPYSLPTWSITSLAPEPVHPTPFDVSTQFPTESALTTPTLTSPSLAPAMNPTASQPTSTFHRVVAISGRTGQCVDKVVLHFAAGGSRSYGTNTGYYVPRQELSDNEYVTGVTQYGSSTTNCRNYLFSSFVFRITDFCSGVERTVRIDGWSFDSSFVAAFEATRPKHIVALNFSGPQLANTTTVESARCSASPKTKTTYPTRTPAPGSQPNKIPWHVRSEIPTI